MKKLLSVICAFSLALASCGCQGDSAPSRSGKEKPSGTDTPSGQEEEPGQETPDIPEEPETPKVPDMPENAGDVVPLSSSVTHVQPMTGLVLWTDRKSSAKYIQLEYSYMLYSDVCKKKDVYDWTVVDNLLADVASRGHQAVLRFRYVYVGKPCAVPDYIKKWDGYEETSAKSEGRTTYFPDWSCQELQRFHKEFHRRFAERYDNDPRLAFLQTGFGLWAEYHVYDFNGSRIPSDMIGKAFPSHAFQAEFLPLMDKWFRKTPWLISVDAADSYYAPFHSTASLLDLSFGNFDDSFMCEDWDDENWKNWSFFGKQRYKKGPAGGEFSYYESYDQKHCLDPGGMYGRKFEDLAAKVHLSFIIGNDQPGKQTDARLKEASMAMGYRFQIDDFRVNPGVSASVLISNVGIAPIYRDAFVSVEGVRGAFNLKYLMPGESTWIQIECASSENSRPAVECDHLVSGQSIEYQASVK